MKSSKINLVTAWQWLDKELEERDLTANQQLILFHLFIKINRNFWQPTKISLNKLSVAMAKDKRTVSKGLAELIEMGLVIEVEGGYFIGYSQSEKLFDDRIGTYGKNGAGSKTPGRTHGSRTSNGNGNRAGVNYKDRAEDLDAAYNDEYDPDLAELKKRFG